MTTSKSLARTGVAVAVRQKADTASTASRQGKRASAVAAMARGMSEPAQANRGVAAETGPPPGRKPVQSMPVATVTEGNAAAAGTVSTVSAGTMDRAAFGGWPPRRSGL